MDRDHGINVTRHISECAAALTYDALPPELVELTKQIVLDTLGVAEGARRNSGILARAAGPCARPAAARCKTDARCASFLGHPQPTQRVTDRLPDIGPARERVDVPVDGEIRLAFLHARGSRLRLRDAVQSRQRRRVQYVKQAEAGVG